MKFCSQGNVMLKAITFMVCIAFLPLGAKGEPKPYQWALINEPASLMDLHVLRANIYADSFSRRVNDRGVEGNFKENEINYMEWGDSTWPAIFKPPLSNVSSDFTFDFEAGVFRLRTRAEWVGSYWLLGDEFNIEHYKRVRTTKSNLEKACRTLFVNASKVLPDLEAHSGYTNKNVSIIKSKSAWQAYLKDLTYEAKIYLGGMRKPPFVKCEGGWGILDEKSEKITVSFKGWFEGIDEAGMRTELMKKSPILTHKSVRMLNKAIKHDR